MPSTSLVDLEFQRGLSSTSDTGASPDYRDLYFQHIRTANREYIDSSAGDYIGWHIYDIDSLVGATDSIIRAFEIINSSNKRGKESPSAKLCELPSDTKVYLEILPDEQVLVPGADDESCEPELICHDYAVEGIKVDWKRAKELYERIKRS